MKHEHDFKGEATVAEFRSAVAQEFLDNLKGVKVYVRKYGVGCWKVASIEVEDSGVYISAGDESNPQNTIEAQLENGEAMFGAEVE